MTFSIRYKALFKVDILHLYALSNGSKLFFAMNAAEKEKQLDNYDANFFFQITPTSGTKQKLRNYNLVFRHLNTGFTVWTKTSADAADIPFTALENDFSLSFLVKLTDPLFYNYTSLKLNNQAKLNYFTNRKPQSESNGFPLLKISGANTTIDETSALSASGAASALQKLLPSERINLFGLIQIYMKGDTSSLDLIKPDGKISNPNKSFEIVFNNRQTIWRYIFRKDQQVKNKDDVKIETSDPKILITKSEQPLTQKGFIAIELGGKDLPNPDSQLMKPDTLNNRYYSEIYM